jgi:hypothetical protein
VPKENAFDYNDAMLEAAVDQAVAVERERCAKIADKAHKKVQDVGAAGPYVASEIAAAIRNSNE